VLPKAEFRRLGDSSAISLREFLQTCEVLEIVLDDPGLALDIDTPEDYQHAKRLMSQSGNTV
jgi:CTP:molybdopterin cytidylyltransferase MocA